MPISGLRTGGLLMVLAVAGFGQAPQLWTDCDRPIANVRHDDIHFSVSIDCDDSRFLRVMVPERDGIQPRPVSIKLRFRDESSVEGTPEGLISTGGGGFTDLRYRFDGKRPLTIAAIFSVTITVGNQSFELYPRG